MIKSSTSAASPTDWSKSDGTIDLDNTSYSYTNTTTINDKNEDDDDDDKLLYRCFKHQGCGECLDEENCSWCPFVRVLLFFLPFSPSCLRSLDRDCFVSLLLFLLCSCLTT